MRRVATSDHEHLALSNHLAEVVGPTDCGWGACLEPSEGWHGKNVHVQITVVVCVFYVGCCVGRTSENISVMEDEYTMWSQRMDVRISTYISYELLSAGWEPTEQNSDRGGGTAPVAV